MLGRASGPLHVRLVVMPTVAAILAIRDGLKAAREGKPAFLWAIVAGRAERRQVLRSAWKGIRRVFVMALVLDTAYQLFALRTVHVAQALIVGVVLAILPYVLIRGPVARLARFVRSRQPARRHRLVSNATPEGGPREAAGPTDGI